MKLKDFDYKLPPELIAQAPIKPRDQSRLLVLEKETGEISHRHFFNLADYLKRGDVLVLNNTKVMPARLIGKKAGTGGRVEVFLLKKETPFNPPLEGGQISPPSKGSSRFGEAEAEGVGEVWQCLVGGKRTKDNLLVEFAGGLKAEILKNNFDGTSALLGAGTWQVKFNKRGADFMTIVKKIGQVPLPPYIKRARQLKRDRLNYQTVYADDKKIGSVAAPTAGFHFTKKLIAQLKKKGVQFESVSLQVGLGTFASVKVEDITKHQMHAEWIEISKKTLAKIIKAKSEGRRIIAVGTTSARTLESVFQNYSNKCHCEPPLYSRRRSNLRHIELANNRFFLQNTKYVRLLRRPDYGASHNDKIYSGWTNIFIYPGYKFKAVDALITNFHLPKSTLLMLISALAGSAKIKKAYREALKQKYRFYSYGDAMFIH